MLYDTLKQLMEYIRHDQNVDVCKQEGLSKWIIDGFDSCLMTSSMKNMHITVGQKIHISRIVKILERKVVVVSERVTGNSALWTTATKGACNKCLLWIIADINSKNRMALMPDPIAAHHFNTRFTNRVDWC
jgi:hypothetical protein